MEVVKMLKKVEHPSFLLFRLNSFAFHLHFAKNSHFMRKKYGCYRWSVDETGYRSQINERKNGFSKFLPAIAVLTILLITGGFVVMLLQQNNEKSQLTLENWDSHSEAGYNVSDLTVRGIILDVKTNYEIRGHYTYHVFPAVIYINITEVVWASEQLMAEMGIRELTNDTWNYQNSIAIAYDKPDMPELSRGQLVEARGCYYRLSGSVYGGKLVVALGVDGSYVKLLDHSSS
ncbi:MAG: hypothetical protein ACPLIG_03940 [Candidatus Bathyarchaeales archaeon]